MTALRRDLGLAVPEPVPTDNGELSVAVEVSGVPETRHCSLLRWMSGRMAGKEASLEQMQALGRLMATLHDHAIQWQAPDWFERRHWDWEGLFGDGAGFQRPAEDVWSLIPKKYRPLLERVAKETEDGIRQLGKGPDVYGLIHGDLDVEGNILYANGEPRAIDFDDCGYGHWLYDVAIAMYGQKDRDLWPANLHALLGGYREVRSLSEDHLAYLGLFLAARHATMVLWGLDWFSLDEPGMKERVEEWLDWQAKHMEESLNSSFLAEGA